MLKRTLPFAGQPFYTVSIDLCLFLAIESLNSRSEDGADIGFGSGLTERAAKSRAAEFASLRWPRAR